MEEADTLALPSQGFMTGDAGACISIPRLQKQVIDEETCAATLHDAVSSTRSSIKTQNAEHTSNSEKTDGFHVVLETQNPS